MILTRVDLVEKQICSKNKDLEASDIQNIIYSIKDQKIERIIDKLGVKRSNIHFIENYHSKTEENIIDIDYHSLKTLNEIINTSEQFLLYYYNKNATCFARCF